MPGGANRPARKGEERSCCSKAWSMLFQQKDLGLQSRHSGTPLFSSGARRGQTSARFDFLAPDHHKMTGKIVTSKNTTALVFAATMTLAGFLLFQVQLVLGKFILPWFGGSASTWLVCMLFFQVALLVGYAHAYAITLPLTIRRQAQLQIGILVLTLLLLPIAPSDDWKPVDANDPTWRILGLLAVCVGLPYIALVTTTPLLSRWLAHIAPDLNPVRFFAASNIGSFLGLLSYPFFFERLLPSVEQTRWWSWAYVLYAALFAACGALTSAPAASSGRCSRPACRARPAPPRSRTPAPGCRGSSLRSEASGSPPAGR